MPTDDSNINEAGIRATIDQLSDSFPNIEELLAEHGVNVDEVEQVTARYRTSPGAGPLRRCWEVCVRIKGVEICYEKCR